MTPATLSMMESLFAMQRNYLEMWTRALAPTTRRDLVPVPEQQAQVREQQVQVREQQHLREQEANEDQVIAVGEERIDVTKRRINGAATRVRRVVKTLPVQRRVELHDYTVVVERLKPNGQEVSDALDEREFIMWDSVEVPEVNKHVNLRELVVLHRRDNSRIVTVQETAKRSEVEIEQPERVPVVIAEQQRAGN